MQSGTKNGDQAERGYPPIRFPGLPMLRISILTLKNNKETEKGADQ